MKYKVIKGFNSRLITHIAIILCNTVHLILTVMNQLDPFLAVKYSTHHQTQISRHPRFKDIYARIMAIEPILITRRELTV